MAADELIFDEGVLRPAPVCEFQGFRAAAQCGGAAILPWRAQWRMADERGVAAFPSAQELPEASFPQALVHLQKSRAATWRDLHHAWQHLAAGGRLLLCGGNELGITSAVKRLARELEQPARILANRRHARITLFHRDRSPGPTIPEASRIPLPPPHAGDHPLLAEPGVFSARRLDRGTEMLLEALVDEAPAGRIIDLGCGIGSLGLSALGRWPDARALLLDADARAVESARQNASSLGVAERCQVDWWDCEESCPEEGFDLALVNPPFHSGRNVDLRPARAFFERLGEVLAPGARALIVANRTLPYEHSLRAIGEIEVLRSDRGYKIIALRRRGRGNRHSRRPLQKRAPSRSAR